MSWMPGLDLDLRFFLTQRPPRPKTPSSSDVPAWAQAVKPAQAEPSRAEPSRALVQGLRRPRARLEIWKISRPRPKLRLGYEYFNHVRCLASKREGKMMPDCSEPTKKVPDVFPSFSTTDARYCLKLLEFKSNKVVPTEVHQTFYRSRAIMFSFSARVVATRHLAVMRLISSERAFSSAGITVSKRRNRLKGDIVKSLQFMKCFYRQDLLFREQGPWSGLEVVVENEELKEELNAAELKAEVASTAWDSIIDTDEDDDY
ncbi:hypothetical protein C8J56DRAFT_897579 [Mycena floridula]|nr:hypothetical protein C8J56DRAFT_897579 [Mycena floridula]